MASSGNTNDNWPMSDPNCLPKLWDTSTVSRAQLRKMAEDLWANFEADEMDSEDMDNESETASANLSFANQISEDEYFKQARSFTKSAVEQLLASDDYKRKMNKCRMCWCCWHEGQFSAECPECGGYPMTRPCPVCDGRCSSVWERDVEMTHSYHEAHWNGQCKLNFAEQQGFLQAKLMETPIDETSLVEDFSVLQTNMD